MTHLLQPIGKVLQVWLYQSGKDLSDARFEPIGDALVSSLSYHHDISSNLSKEKTRICIYILKLNHTDFGLQNLINYDMDRGVDRAVWADRFGFGETVTGL